MLQLILWTTCIPSRRNRNTFRRFMILKPRELMGHLTNIKTLLLPLYLIHFFQLIGLNLVSIWRLYEVIKKGNRFNILNSFRICHSYDTNTTAQRHTSLAMTSGKPGQAVTRIIVDTIHAGTSIAASVTNALVNICQWKMNQRNIFKKCTFQSQPLPILLPLPSLVLLL